MDTTNDEALIHDAVAAEIKTQVARALSHTREPHACGSCDRQTDNDAEVCRGCQKGGAQADPLHQLGRRLGFKLGVPIDLLEKLALPTEELLSMTQAELCARWDETTSYEMPVLVEESSFVSGTSDGVGGGVRSGGVLLYGHKVITTAKTPPAPRPMTDSERAQKDWQQKELDRVDRRLRQDVARERRIEAAKAELAAATTVVVGGDR